MANLYDMELQESNNFLIALVGNGVTPALKMMEEQFTMAKSMGEAGKELLVEFENPESEMAKNFAKVQQLRDDIKSVMAQLNFDPELAKKASEIFNRSPESLSSLNEVDRKTISDYWIKKKSAIVVLLKKGYTHEEIFS